MLSAATTPLSAACRSVRGQARDVPAPTPGAWVELLPGPEVATRDERGPYRLTDPAAVVARFAADYPPGSDQAALVDYEHADLRGTAPGGMAPAAGWLTALRVSEAGGVEGLIDWTERAAALLAAREARYISPELLVDPSTGEVVAITGAGLTQRPNLYLRALASRDLPETEPMNDELAERLRYLLNLPVTSTAPEIADQIDRLVQQLRGSTVEPMRAVGLLGSAGSPADALVRAQQMRAGLDDVSQALGLAADAEPAVVLASARAAVGDADNLLALQSAACDVLAEGLGYQPADGQTGTLAEVAQAAVARVRALESAAQDREAADLVSAAMRERRLTPAEAEAWGRALARRDAETFGRIVQSREPIIREQQQPPAGEAGGGEASNEFAALVSAHMRDAKVSRGQAMMAMARAHPEAHRAWVEQTQAQREHQRA